MQVDGPAGPAEERIGSADTDLQEEERERRGGGRKEAAVGDLSGDDEGDERRQRERSEGLVSGAES